MSQLRFRISMSLDGYVAGPNQSTADPLGVGGERLHHWAFATRAFQEIHADEKGGEDNESSKVIEESFANIGATIMGRNMFGGHPGPWDRATPWTGWWGENPPFQHPVFVLTHHPRDPLTLDGTTFTFVTDGIESAFAQARRAAKGKDVALAGGAQAAQQFLRGSFVDEMEIHLVPILLGSGERLFDHLGENLHGLQLERTIATPEVVHLKFTR